MLNKKKKELRKTELFFNLVHYPGLFFMSFLSSSWLYSFLGRFNQVFLD
jgi:hypothetical protein